MQQHSLARLAYPNSAQNTYISLWVGKSISHNDYIGAYWLFNLVVMQLTGSWGSLL